VPLDSNGDFFLPLWTDFRTGGDVGILDWYTILVGVLATLTLTMHGALWVAYKAENDLAARSQACARTAWGATLLFTLLVTAATFTIQPQVLDNFERAPWGAVFPALALAGLAGIHWFNRKTGADRDAFLASCVFIVGMLTSAAFGVFPYVLPSNTNPGLGLTIFNTATGAYGLRVALVWWIPGMALALGYSVFTYRRFAGKVRLEQGGH
jgi:cytochrome d ubiquinol oxidase subunit II